MNLADVIENYIRQLMVEDNFVELKRSDVANHFGCVPSQINYVISTRFVPESGYYVESKRGGGGYIKISRQIRDRQQDIEELLQKIEGKMSQHVVDIYLQNFLSYNVVTKEQARLIKVATSDKSLTNVDFENKDKVRADVFKNIVISII